MSHVVRSADLPRLRSTRDGRDRVDLVTEDLFGCNDLKADLITYEPGDTAGDSEVHWFENPYDEPFAFYEWVPAPRDTIWVREDDVCTWEPSA